MEVKTTEIPLNSSWVFLHERHANSQIIYCMILISLAISLIALPFIYISVGIKSSAIIKGDLDKIELFANTSGHLLSMNLKENQSVKKGAVLLTIDGPVPQQQSIVSARTNSLHLLIQDAEKILEEVRTPSLMNLLKLKTGYYEAAWHQFLQQAKNARSKVEHTKKSFQRYFALYQKEVVTKAEFEQYSFFYEQAISEEQMTSRTVEAQWQKELNEYLKELKNLQDQDAQLSDKYWQHFLKAPVNGSIQNLTGIQKGSFVHTNQKIAEISPDGTLYAYCFVKPADIGLIKIGQTVTFQVEAFNHNQWGLLNGKVADISDDTILHKQDYYFKIKCILNKNYLRLTNGYRGIIKKGMTCIANFTVTKRSLYQLLFDKVDDWVS